MRSLVYRDGKPVIVEMQRADMVCTARRARLAMMQTPYPEFPSLLTAVEGVIYGSDNPALIVSWEYATEWQRTDPAIDQIGAALGLTASQIDNLFIAAMAI